jgi:predicted DNA-binding protein with PD1-like motif
MRSRPMQCSEGAVGRVFVIRLEHGEPMPQSLEQLAQEKGIRCGLAVMVGGAEGGSRFVVGPQDGEATPVVPMVGVLPGVHEAAAVGTLFPDEAGRPVLHMHAAFGRGDQTRSGCIREGIVAWQVLEIILLELVGLDAVRLPDAATGFRLLQCR